MKQAGFFREIDTHVRLAPADSSIVSARGTLLANGAKQDLVEYLSGATILVSSPGLSDDYFGSGDPVPMGLVTDGEWLWPADYSYYVKKYDVAVPAELITRAEDAHGRPSPVPRERLLEIEDELLASPT